MTIVTPSTPFKKILHIMAFGSWIDASFNSSNMCAPASGPMKHQIGLVGQSSSSNQYWASHHRCRSW